MITIDEHIMRAPAALCFHVAADVERWPDILPHYRRVRFQNRRDFGRGRVAMAAWRDFLRPLRYPTRWVSDMRSDASAPAIYYHHVDGVTRGMDVRWEFFAEEQAQEGREGENAHVTRVRIIHEWTGPPWPLIGRIAADYVIGPHFISAIARRTLLGVAAEAERRAADRVQPRSAAEPQPRSATDVQPRSAAERQRWTVGTAERRAGAAPGEHPVAAEPETTAAVEDEAAEAERRAGNDDHG